MGNCYEKLSISASVLTLSGCNKPGVVLYRDVQKEEYKLLTVCYDGIEQNSFRTSRGYVVLVPRFTKDNKVIPCEN